MIVTSLNYDKFYFEQLLVLLTSIRINSPNDMVSIFLVDFPKEVEHKLNIEFDKFKFINRTLNVSSKKNVAGFMVCYRSLVVKECLEIYKEPTAWFDTDIIVRNDLKLFWNGVDTDQLKILYRGDSSPKHTRFQAGVFAVGYSEDTMKYISEWNNVIQSSHLWYEDQKQLYILYTKYSDRIKLIKMDKGFNDVGDSNKKESFSDDSTIWHCKKPHFYNKKFRKEYLKYLKMVRGNFDD